MEIIDDQPHSIDSIPMIIGHNSIEGLLGLLDCQKNNKYHLYDKNLTRYIPKVFDLGLDDPKGVEFAEDIREFYFSGRSVSEQTNVELTTLIGDYHFNMEAQFLAEAYSRRQHK